MTAGGASVSPEDLVRYERLGIPPDLLQRVARRVTDKEAREQLGVTHTGDLAGVLFARLHPETGIARGYRLRRDSPEMENGRSRDKYLSSRDRPALFFAPDVAPLLADITVPIVMVEAETSTLTLTASAARTGRAVLAIGMGGCWGWRGRTGKSTATDGLRVDEKGPLADFDRLSMRLRDVVICFDANAATNAKVQAARRALAAELTTRGARVRIADLPVEDGVNGPDDHYAVHGDDALWRIIDAARPVQPASAADVLRLAELDDISGVPFAELEPRFRVLKASLHGADAIRRRTVRELLVATLKTAKISGVAALADAATDGQAGDDLTPSSFVLVDDEPAAVPMTSADLFDQTAARLKLHIVMSTAQIVAITLWIAAVYAIDALQRMAMLLISSPTPECGKSTVATLVSGFVPRPVMVSSLTPAVLYRLIDKYHPTLIADEVDSWLSDEKSEMRGVFNAAHWRQGAFIPRCVGDDHDVQLFNVFGAKLIAMIGRPAPTMLSRSITVTLQRKTARDHVTPLRDESIRDELAPFRQQWRRWALDHVDQLRGYEPVMPAELPINRASDNWRSLLAIAEIVGGAWPARAADAALTLSGVRVTEDEPMNVQLLADIQVVFRERQSSAWTADPKLAYLSSEELIESLKALPERPWADWNKGRGISPAQLAQRLREFNPTSPLGLRTRKTRLDAVKTGQRWHREDFEDAWSRYVTPDPGYVTPDPGYVTPDPEHPEQPNKSGPEPAILNPEQNPVVPGLKNGLPPMNPGLVPGVPGSKPVFRRRRDADGPAAGRERVEL